MLQLLLNFVLPVSLILLAMVVGSILENRHFRSIRERELALAHLPVFNGKRYPEEKGIAHSQMYLGSVVVSVDHFKRLLAGLRMIFGGELGSYASLLDRARREAVLRVLEQCTDADLIVNLRIETSSISKGMAKTINSTEVLAYATAITFSSAER